MAEQKISTAERVWKLAEPVVEECGLVLWDVRFVKEGASWFLRIFIDSENGISIDDCENVSRQIDPILDEEDFITQSYYLEVSSPGLGRELTRPSHFERMRGQKVKIRLIRPKDSQREWRGTLAGYTNGVILLETGEGAVEIGKNETAFVRLLDDEDIGGLLK